MGRVDRLKMVAPVREVYPYVQEMMQEIEADGGGIAKDLRELLQPRGGVREWLILCANVQTCPVTDNVMPRALVLLKRDEAKKTYAMTGQVRIESIVGAAVIRTQLNRRGWNELGNISLIIRPSERGKGCTRALLYLTLCECRRRGMEAVLLVSEPETSMSWLARVMGGKQLLVGNGEREYYMIAVGEALLAYRWMVKPLVEEPI